MTADTKRLDAVIDVFKVRPEHRRPKRIGKQIDVYQQAEDSFDIQVNSRMVASGVDRKAADAKVLEIRALCDRTGVSYTIQHYTL